MPKKPDYPMLMTLVDINDCPKRRVEVETHVLAAFMSKVEVENTF